MTVIGIIGNGFVGRATGEVWKPSHEVRYHDRQPQKRTHSLSETLQADLIFVCLPTPEGEGGKCDTSHLDSFFAEAPSRPQYVVKSTVPVGYTASVAERFGLDVCHNPEFLTARTAIIDALTPRCHMVGSANGPACAILAGMLAERFPGSQVIRTTSEVTEMAKLSLNTYFAVKVATFNELRTWADAEGVGWSELIRVMLADGRIAHMHTQVPGPDGQRGYGGACLPKDIANAQACMESKGVPALVCDAARRRNDEIDRARLTNVHK